MKKMGLLKNNKGFTLIEMIIVLIIIAILAAIGIPAMIRYVDDARQKQNLAACRTLYVAAQAVVTKEIAENLTPGTTVFSAATAKIPAAALTVTGAKAIADKSKYEANILLYADKITEADATAATLSTATEALCAEFEVAGDPANGKVLAVYFEKSSAGPKNAVTIFADGKVTYGTVAATT